MNARGPGPDRAAIAAMLAAHHTLTLATCRDSLPWAATVFFASDADFNLYFVSDRRTRHAQDMAACPEVALAIDADPDGWHAVRGLQVAGTATLVAGTDRPRVLALYLEKFASVKALFEQPRSADEKIIASRLQHTDFWCVRPDYIRLVDNSKGFGFRIEWRPGDATAASPG